MISSASIHSSYKAKSLGVSEGASKEEAGSEGELLDFLNILKNSNESNTLIQNPMAQQLDATADKKNLGIIDIEKKGTENFNSKLFHELVLPEKKLQNNNAVDVKDIGSKEISSKDQEQLLELLSNKKTTGNATDAHLKMNVKNSHGLNETLSPLDFQQGKSSNQSTDVLKKYLKNQNTKILNADNLNLQEKLELRNASPEVNAKMENELNFSNSAKDVMIEGNKQNEKTLVDSLANQITQKINDFNLSKPLRLNSETTIDFHHSELGSMTLHIKKIEKDLNINITTGHTDAKNLIFENRDALLSLLNQKGISVSNLTVESSYSATVADDGKNQQSQKFDSSSQQQNSSHQHDQAKNPNQQNTDREKRNELWNILKDQREVMYA